MIRLSSILSVQEPVSPWNRMVGVAPVRVASGRLSRHARPTAGSRSYLQWFLAGGAAEAQTAAGS